MAKKLEPKTIVAFEELAISNMRKIAAVVEVLERKGLLPKRK